MQKRRIHKKQRGFTLAELLVAIVIIGILFAITLPSLTNLTGQSKLDGAANAVHSASKLARQYAIAHNQPTYLVFHDAQSTTNDNLAYRSYAVFTINIHTNPVDQSAGYYLTDWEALPAGIVFDAESDSDKNLFNAGINIGWNGAFSKKNELLIQGVTYMVAGFMPKGKTTTYNYWTRRILLIEGFYNAGFINPPPKLGKEIKIDRWGKSSIVDIIYNENDEPEEFYR